LFKKIPSLVIFEGILFALMVSTTESYALYYFTKKGLSGDELALISTCPLFLASVAQLFIPRFISNRRIGLGLLLAIVSQIFGIALLIYAHSQTSYYYPLFLGLIFYWIGGQITAPLWLDWLSSCLKSGTLSRFLGLRNSIVTFTIVLVFIAVSQVVKHDSHFKILFFIGLISRLLGLLLQAILLKQTKSKWKIQLSRDISTSMLGHKSSEIFLKILFWSGPFRFACNLSSPFFLLYMLKELKLSTSEYVLLSAIPFLGRSIFVHNWGKATKGLRSFWGIQIATLGIAALPILWALGSNMIYLGFVQILSGILWGGMELSQLIMVQGIFPSEPRKQMGIFLANNNLFSLGGALTGAYLLKLGLTYKSLFIVSGLARFIIGVGLVVALKKYASIKLSRWNSKTYLYSVLSLRPTLTNVGRILFKN